MLYDMARPQYQETNPSSIGFEASFLQVRDVMLK